MLRKAQGFAGALDARVFLSQHSSGRLLCDPSECTCLPQTLPYASHGVREAGLNRRVVVGLTERTGSARALTAWPRSPKRLVRSGVRVEHGVLGVVEASDRRWVGGGVMRVGMHRHGAGIPHGRGAGVHARGHASARSRNSPEPVGPVWERGSPFSSARWLASTCGWEAGQNCPPRL